jgi:hypothetical protein
MGMTRTTNTNVPSKSAFCHFCGAWPATLYMDIKQKTSTPRVCETCVEVNRVVLVDGVYVTNPELPADPVGSDR